MSIIDGQQLQDLAYLNRRQLIRSAKNPQDKCTILSIYPKALDEYKPTIEPGKFHVPPGTFEKPSRLVIGASSWWREIDLDQPMLEIPCSSIQVANSIVTDYTNGMLGCNMSEAVPGLFYVLGEMTVAEAKVRYSEKFTEMKERQNNWFRILVKIADSLWARANGNPLAISDEMRLAARSLGLNDKPWLRDFMLTEHSPCKACGQLRNAAFPVCPSCKAVDMTHPLAKDLKFAV